MYPPVPAEKRKPIRVLSLFDGIATGERVAPTPTRSCGPCPGVGEVCVRDHVCFMLAKQNHS